MTKEENEARISKLKGIVATLPQKPGSYQYYDAEGTIIYVGKAKNLKARVSSYFHSEVDRFKTKVLVSKICDISYTVVNTEEDALKRYESDQIRSAVGSLPEDEREVIERKFFNLQPVGHEGMKVYQKAIKDLRKNKTIRHMIMEDACISRAYDWHDRDTSHTEWCAIKLTEGD